MSRPEEFPRIVPSLLHGYPTRLEFIERYDADDTSCFFIRDNKDEWLAYDGLPPQMIGLPTWAVIILGGTTDPNDAKDATDRLGMRRYSQAFNVENVGEHAPKRHLPIPETHIINEARALDVKLVPSGTDPQSLEGPEKQTYRSKLELIKTAGTLGSWIGIRDKTIHARRLLFEDSERRMTEALIAKARIKRAKEGENLAQVYERAEGRF